MSRGKNNGVEGILSLLVDGVGTAPTFAVAVTSHSSAITFRTKSRRGRGSAGAPKIRITGQDGTGTVTGKMPLTGWPSPDHPEYCLGTLTLVMQTGTTAGSPPAAVDKVDIPVRVTTLSFSLSDPDPDVGDGEEQWDFIGTWTMNGVPVWTWKGIQATIAPPSATDQELYDGLQKVYDVNGLITGAVQRIDCDQIPDDDDSEATKLVTIVAAATAPPLPNLKVVSAVWERPDEDGQGGEIVLTWGLQDSKDNIETPANTWTQDPNLIRDQRTLAQVWVSANTAPAIPAPPAGLKIVTFRDDKRDDQHTVRFWTFGRTDAADDILNPQARASTDPNNLTSTASSGVLFTPGDPPEEPEPPDGLKLRHTDDRKVNDAVANRIYDYGKTDTKDDIVLPKTFTDLDPHAISTRASAADINSTPSLPTGLGLKVRSTFTVKLNDGETLNVVSGALVNTADELLNPEIRTNTDPTGLNTTATTAALFDPGSPPSDPSPPSGLKQRFINDVKVNDALSKRFYDYATNDTSDDLFNAHATSFRSAQSAYRDTVPALYPSTDPIGTVADAAWAGFQGSANAFGLTVRQVNPGNKLILYEYINPGILVEGVARGGSRVVNAQISGGNVQLYVMQNLSRGSGNRLITFSRYHTNLPLRAFTLRRLFIQAPPMPDFSGLIGDVNGSDFLGLAAGTCKYEGPEFTTNIALSGSLPFFMGYQFSVDENGHFLVPDDLFGTQHYLTTATTTQRGWVNASDVGMGSVITQPDQGDFSVFVD